ncbi:Phosphoglycolate phosphatase [Psidium guajava]|nr:Phosphoglycolate phosphatase [Psidium guajava]
MAPKSSEQATVHPANIGSILELNLKLIPRLLKLSEATVRPTNKENDTGLDLFSYRIYNKDISSSSTREKRLEDISNQVRSKHSLQPRHSAGHGKATETGLGRVGKKQFDVYEESKAAVAIVLGVLGPVGPLVLTGAACTLPSARWKFS